MTQSIPLRASNGEVRAYALVDDADFARLGSYRWSINGAGYARRGTADNKTIYLHREILDTTGTNTVEVDHVNRNRLDNRRENLRLATRTQNAQNVPSWTGVSSPYRGVSWIKRDQRWRAVAGFEGTRYYLGRFTDELEAARVVAKFWEARIPDFDYWSTSTPHEKPS